MIALLIFLGFIGLMVWAFYADRKNDKKDYAKRKEEQVAWMAEQAKSPKFKVVVTTKAGKTYETAAFEPESEIEYWFGGWHLETKSSKLLAHSRIEGSIKAARYFHEAENLFIPMCEIETFQAVQDGTS